MATNTTTAPPSTMTERKAGDLEVTGRMKCQDGFYCDKTSAQLVVKPVDYAVTMTFSEPSAARTITVPDPGANCNLQLGMKAVKTIVENTATTLTNADSGKILTIPQSTHNDSATINCITLPSVTAGFNIRAVFSAAGDDTAGHGWRIISPTAVLCGTRLGTANCTSSYDASATNIQRDGTLADAQAGDFIDIWSDGTNYYYYAFSSGTASPWNLDAA